MIKLHNDGSVSPSALIKIMYDIENSSNISVEKINEFSLTIFCSGDENASSTSDYVLGTSGKSCWEFRKRFFFTHWIRDAITLFDHTSSTPPSSNITIHWTVTSPTRKVSGNTFCQS